MLMQSSLEYEVDANGILKSKICIGVLQNQLFYCVNYCLNSSYSYHFLFQQSGERSCQQQEAESGRKQAGEARLWAAGRG